MDNLKVDYIAASFIEVVTHVTPRNRQQNLMIAIVCW
jgi:hypothetical protein